MWRVCSMATRASQTTSMTEPILSDELKARYLAGDIAPLERARVDAWIALDGANRTEMDALRKVWQARNSDSKWDVNRAWSRVDARIDAAPRPALTVVKGSNPSWPNRTLITRIAAGLVLAASVTYWWQRQSASPPQMIAAFSTGIGEQRDTVLADSTRIVLGPMSTLFVASDYGVRGRDVELAGEAWFQVHHDAEHPFSVHAAGTITQDIGTEFTVRALTSDTVVRVEVSEGVASLRREGSPMTGAVELRASDIGVLTSGATAVRVERNKAAQRTWREGQLSFDGAFLSEVIAELRRWYAAPIVLSDPALGTRRFSAPLPARDLTEALDILRLALGVEIVQRGDTVIVR